MTSIVAEPRKLHLTALKTTEQKRVEESMTSLCRTCGVCTPPVVVVMGHQEAHICSNLVYNDMKNAKDESE